MTQQQTHLDRILMPKHLQCAYCGSTKERELTVRQGVHLCRRCLPKESGVRR